MEASGPPKTSRKQDPQRAMVQHEWGHSAIALTGEHREAGAQQPGPVPARCDGSTPSPTPLEIIGRYLKGDHRLMTELRARIARQAEGRLPVLFTGETGTGKQMAA